MTSNFNYMASLCDINACSITSYVATTDLDYGSAEFMTAREQAGSLCFMRYNQLLKQYISKNIFKNKNKYK